MCNHYYFYVVDEDFGPLFIKFSGYFPYTARACLNGHEYAKCQLRKEGIAFEALDNGMPPAPIRRAAADRRRAGCRTHRAVVRKWLARLPQPFTDADRAAGYDYDISILQAEFARTQVFDRPLSGRHLFEEIIRENLDLGRPEQVSLIFDRRITRRTPGRFRTRVITRGVTPSLHIDYKSTASSSTSRKSAPCAPRRPSTTPATSASADACATCPRCGPSALPPTAACWRSSASARTATSPSRSSSKSTAPACRRRPTRLGPAVRQCQGHGPVPGAVPVRAAARGLPQRRLRGHVAELLGIPLEAYTPGRMTYDLRRLRLHGLIVRIPHTQRYDITPLGKRVALFFTKLHARLIRPGLSQLFDGCPKAPNRPLAKAIHGLDSAFEHFIAEAKLAA
jgi:hypothetical protein